MQDTITKIYRAEIYDDNQHVIGHYYCDRSKFDGRTQPAISLINGGESNVVWIDERTIKTDWEDWTEFLPDFIYQYFTDHCGLNVQR